MVIERNLLLGAFISLVLILTQKQPKLKLELLRLNEYSSDHIKCIYGRN